MECANFQVCVLIYVIKSRRARGFVEDPELCMDCTGFLSLDRNGAYWCQIDNEEGGFASVSVHHGERITIITNQSVDPQHVTVTEYVTLKAGALCTISMRCQLSD